MKDICIDILKKKGESAAISQKKRKRMRNISRNRCVGIYIGFQLKGEMCSEAENTQVKEEQKKRRNTFFLTEKIDDFLQLRERNVD